MNKKLLGLVGVVLTTAACGTAPTGSDTGDRAPADVPVFDGVGLGSGGFTTPPPPGSPPPEATSVAPDGTGGEGSEERGGVGLGSGGRSDEPTPGSQS